MDKLHIGHTDDENYSFYGKLADGTPIYRYCPPPPPDPNILKEQKKKKREIIDNYNATTNLNETNTSDFIDVFEQELQKEQNKAKYLETVIPENFEELSIEPTEDKHNVLNYIEPVNTSEPVEEVLVDENTTDYLDLFKVQEEQDLLKQHKEESVRQQIQEAIDKEDDRRNKSAQKYKDYVTSLKEDELKQLALFEDVIAEKEKILHDEYESLLIEDPVPEFYANDATFKTSIDPRTRSVTVTNEHNGAQRTFNYLGSLESAEIKGYKLRLYSTVRDDKEYGVIKEAYKFLTHRHMTYDLRTGQILKRDTFVISKLDPMSINCTDEDVYYEGWDWQTRTLSAIGEPYIYTTTPIQDGVITIDGTLNAHLDGVTTKVIPIEIIVEAYGAGGAGLSGVDNTQGSAGGGGAYVRKTISISPFQTYPLNIRYGVGDGALAPRHPTTNIPQGINNQTDWNNASLKKYKDSYFILANFYNDSLQITSPLSCIAAGGYDGYNDRYFASESSGPGVDAGWPGRPLGDYDIGYWGSGNLPWSTMKYHLSTIPGLTDPLPSQAKWETILYGTNNHGAPHNGALSGGHGAGSNDPVVSATLNIGMSSGWSATTSRNSIPGASPAGGGGGPGYSNDALMEWYETGTPGEFLERFVSYRPYVSGSPGGEGSISITITKGIINREAFS